MQSLLTFSHVCISLHVLFLSLKLTYNQVISTSIFLLYIISWTSFQVDHINVFDSSSIFLQIVYLNGHLLMSTGLFLFAVTESVPFCACATVSEASVPRKWDHWVKDRVHFKITNASTKFFPKTLYKPIFPQASFIKLLLLLNVFNI